MRKKNNNRKEKLHSHFFCALRAKNRFSFWSLCGLPLLFSMQVFAQGKRIPEVKQEQLSQGRVFLITQANPSYKIDSARFAIFIPDGIDRIQGLLVHQHGCTMEGRGTATAYDLQYQALAKKWNLAIVGPDFYDAEKNCHDWKEPQNGTADAFFRSLRQVAALSGKQELSEAPWLLWGHSGGAYWSQAMLRDYPDRVMALFSYSPGLDPKFTYPQAALRVPVMIRHAGPEGDACCIHSALNTFRELRSAKGHVGISYTPHQNHNFSFVRYLAIPFFEAVMRQRLSSGQSTYKTMKPMDISLAWLADTASLNIYPAAKFPGNVEQAAWLPDSAIAVKWREFSITGTIRDRSAPPPPYNVKIQRRHNVTVELSWKADADIESGISHFNIYRGDQLVARYPSSGNFQNFDTNGDDAYPLIPLPMKTDIMLLWNDSSKPGISTVNHFGLESVRTVLE